MEIQEQVMKDTIKRKGSGNHSYSQMLRNSTLFKQLQKERDKEVMKL